MPTTLGTVFCVPGLGTREALSWTRVPAFGRWATTVPFGCVDGTVNASGTRPAPRIDETALARGWPTTSGTWMSPRETRMTSVEPFATFTPAGGLWPSTTPAGFREMTLDVCTARPRLRR